MENKDTAHDIVLARFSWPSSQQAASHVHPDQQHLLKGIWAVREAAMNGPAPPQRRPRLGLIFQQRKAVREAAAAAATSESSVSSGEQPSTPAVLHSETAEHAKRARITDSSAAAASSSSNAAVSDGGAAGASLGVVNVYLSDDESSEHTSTAKDHITEETGWEHVYTILMLFEGITGRPPGSVNFCDAPEMPILSLQQGQLQIIGEICDQLLYGYSRSGATEHGDPEDIRTDKDVAMLISNMGKALDYRARFHKVDDILSEEKMGKNYIGWMREWLLSELRPNQQHKQHSEKTYIAAAWVRQTFGSKALLMALLQFGPNLMPSGAP